MAGDSWDDRGSGQAPSRPRSDYIPKVRLLPTTLDDLMNRAGPYADAVKAHLKYSAVTTWLMKADDPLAAAFIPVEAGNLSVLLTRQALEHEAGWPASYQRGQRRPQESIWEAQGIDLAGIPWRRCTGL